MIRVYYLTVWWPQGSESCYMSFLQQWLSGHTSDRREGKWPHRKWSLPCTRWSLHLYAPMWQCSLTRQRSHPTTHSTYQCHTPQTWSHSEVDKGLREKMRQEVWNYAVCFNTENHPLQSQSLACLGLQRAAHGAVTLTVRCSDTKVVESSTL